MDEVDYGREISASSGVDDSRTASGMDEPDRPGGEISIPIQPLADVLGPGGSALVAFQFAVVQLL